MAHTKKTTKRTTNASVQLSQTALLLTGAFVGLTIAFLVLAIARS